MPDILSEHLLYTNEDHYDINNDNDKNKPIAGNCCDCYCDIFSWSILLDCCINCCNAIV